jgi:HPt (histidine-containing phosphotransfer) domain-containing protein
MTGSIDPLADLRFNYAKRLRVRIGALAEFLSDARVGNLCDSAIAENHRCVHSMASSAAIFGHLELSAAARAAEQAFEQGSAMGTESLINQIETLIRYANDVLAIYETPTN